MRRMMRHLFTLCAALSLVLSVAMTGTWLIAAARPIYFGNHGQYAIVFDHRWELSLCLQGEWCVGAPVWMLILGTVVLPAVRWRASARVAKLLGRTSRAGLCKRCGYDLRAHSAGERCPECGTAVKA